MALWKSQSQRWRRNCRYCIILLLGLAFLVVELVFAIKTRSVALFADAFHYLNDLVCNSMPLVADYIATKKQSPGGFSFGWQRGQLLAAFFNGAFLLALGVSIFLESLEKFIFLEPVQQPLQMLVVGCIGLVLNVMSVAVLGHDHAHHHRHGSSPCQDRGSEEELGLFDGHHLHRHTAKSTVEADNKAAMMGGLARVLSAFSKDLAGLGVLMHVLGDAVNNLGVMAAASLINYTKYPARFYADPAVSLAMSVMIMVSVLPMLKKAGLILLQSGPSGVNLADVQFDLEQIPGIESVHELHVWALDESKNIASAHVLVSDPNVLGFMAKAKTIGECLHAYNIHSATLQPELSPETASLFSLVTGSSLPPAETRRTLGAEPESGAASPTPTSSHHHAQHKCHLVCGSGLCRSLTCCTTTA